MSRVQVVAQGIETLDQLAALARMGCTLGEGPLLSPPVDAEQAIEIAEKRYWAITSGTTLWS